MSKFMTLRPKMYAYKVGNSKSKKCKGIKKNCLFSGEASYRLQLMFRSSKHEVRTLEVNKLGLSRDDDKRITNCGWNI